MQSVRRAGWPLVAPCHMGAWGQRGVQGNCAHVLRIPLVSSQGNEEVPAVAGEGTPAWDDEDEGSRDSFKCCR